MRKIIKESDQKDLIFCSFCGQLTPLRRCYTFTGVFYKQEKPVQCPHCGAFMYYGPLLDLYPIDPTIYTVSHRSCHMLSWR